MVFELGDCAGSGKGRLCLQQEGVLLIWIMVGQGRTMFVVGASLDCLDIFFSPIIFFFFPFSRMDG